MLPPALLPTLTLRLDRPWLLLIRLVDLEPISFSSSLLTILLAEAVVGRVIISRNSSVGRVGTGGASSAGGGGGGATGFATTFFAAVAAAAIALAGPVALEDAAVAALLSVGLEVPSEDFGLCAATDAGRLAVLVAIVFAFSFSSPSLATDAAVGAYKREAAGTVGLRGTG